MMLANYLKLSFRLMMRSPFFTGINVFGLAIGFAAFFALWDFSVGELQSDQYHNNADQIARIGWHWRWTDDGKKWDYVTSSLSKSDIPVRVKEDFPEIEDYCRILPQQMFSQLSDGLVPHGSKVILSATGKNKDRVFKEEHVIYADKNLFKFFYIPLVRGGADDVLAEGGSIALSESQALKYFGNDNPIGELLKLNDSITLKVTGVFKDLPHNTHLLFNVVISNAALTNKWATAFNQLTANYIRLRGGVSLQDFEEKLNGRRKEYFSAILQRITNTDIDMFVQPLSEIIFSPNFLFDEFTYRSKSLLTTFAVISIVILALAWINYINLWIARNKKREKELATRRINGARGKDFVLQFLTESAVVNAFAVILAVTLLQLVRTPFHSLFNINIAELSQLNLSSRIIFIGVFILSIGLTGLYPALIARRNNLLRLLKNTKDKNNKGLFTSSLAIVQYTVAITLILWSSIVYSELNHILKQDVGINRENVLVIEIPGTRNSEVRLDALTNKLGADPAVNSAAYALLTPAEGMGTLNTRLAGSTTQVGFEWNGVSESYIPFFDLKIVAGRNFVAGDREGVTVISEEAARRHGFKNPADAVGSKLEVLTDEALNGWPTVEIIGVVKDYRSFPFFETPGATAEFSNEYDSQGRIFFYKNRGLEMFPIERLLIKTRPGNWNNDIASIERYYSDAFPATPFIWYFLEDKMNTVYSNEQVTGNQISLFVILAVVIACLGFQAMIAHKVTSKIKEIGIRKILGASITHIGRIILQPSVIQFGISIVLGVPIAWYLGQVYLQKFSERVDLSWVHFTAPLLLLISILLGAVGGVVWKATMSNPVDSLKHE